MAGQKRKYGPYNDEYIELGRMPKEQRRPLPSGSRRHQEKVGKSQNSVSTVSRRGKEMENTKDRNLFDALQQADNRKSQKTQLEDVPSRNPLTEILNERNQDGLISDEDLSDLLKIHDPLTGLQLLMEDNPTTSENQLIQTPHLSPLPPPVSPLPPSPAPPMQSSIVEAPGQNRIRRALGDDDFISFFDVRPIIIAPLDEEESALALLDEENALLDEEGNALLDEEGNENGKEDHEGSVCAEVLPGSINNSRGSIEDPILIDEAEDDGNVHLELNIMVRAAPIKKRTSPPAQVRASPPAPQLAPIATPSTLPSPYAPPNIAVSPPPGAGVFHQPPGTSQVHCEPGQQQQSTYREVHQVSQQYQAPAPQMNPFAQQYQHLPTRYSVECPPSGVQGMVNVVSRFAPTTSYYPVGPENGMVGGRPVYSGAAPQMMMSHSHNAPGGGTVPAVPQSRAARHSHYSAAPQQVQVTSQYYAAPQQQPQRAPPISAAQWQDMMSRLNEKEKDLFLANLPEVLNRIHMRSRNVA